MKSTFTPRIAPLAALLTLGLMALAGCSGGAGTEENPDTRPPTAGPSYSGPAPATDDIQAFRVELWENIRSTDRCGNCHKAGGQSPQFARSDDVNAAYQQASGVVDRVNPSQSTMVLKVGSGHNCWLPDPGACASILTRWITSWVGSSATGGRQIELLAPELKDPGQSRRFPPTAAAASFGAVHAVLNAKCSGCHKADAAVPQQPFFAADDIDEAYQAAIPKINLDDPAASRFVIRLRGESHNCWQNTVDARSDCAYSSDVMQAAIQQMTDAITPSHVDPSLVVSKALTLYDGTIASGGNRYENNLIALYEFKTGSGATAYDTSGVEPAANLTLQGQRLTDYDWVGGWGVVFKTPMAKAQADTTASRKFQQLITATGEYSIEAWVIPGNVTQEDARIVSYSGSTTARNFTMGQTLYNYDFMGRSTATGTNGTPTLSTADADERLQASLQHVVLTFDPVNGRRIYVNGEFTGDLDSAGGGTLGEWDNSFAFVVGNEVSSNRPWAGVVRLVAIHNRALTLAQIQQNFQAGVGEKFFLLFGVEHITNVPKSYVLFEVTQYDSYGYLFTNPKFVSLDPTAMPGNIRVSGMRIGVNGAEPHVGQAYRLLDTTIADSGYSATTGFPLSSVGTIIGLENGPISDEFYLCFDQLGSHMNVCSQYASAIAPTYGPDPAASSDIGVKTFDAINATMASVTGVSPNTPTVHTAFSNVRQSLPAVPSIQAFLSSHQTSIAQLAITYCAALTDDTAARASYFPGLDFVGGFSSAGQRNALINPLIDRVFGNAASQPDANTVRTELDALVTRLCPSDCTGARTATVVKSVCGAAVGNAATLVH